MSEKLIRFLLSELGTIRIICHNKVHPTGPECGGIVEVPLAKLGSVDKCPLCKEGFRGDTDSIDRFGDFALAVGRLKEQTERYGLEFVLPDDE
ncbi:MAG TPA: hypothetical protein VFE78_11970 [Gemmataceae bacterium]|nr:hypothetical protein [Gemmataceae bacterium]